MTAELLKLSTGNAKLAKDRLIFNLPAGYTCPGAQQCKAFAYVNDEGKHKIKDTPLTEFRCFAASSEAQYPAVFEARRYNLKLIVNSLRDDDDYRSTARLIADSIEAKRTRNTTKVRIHESGDFYSEKYFLAWCEVAKMLPELDFYCYSKSLPIIKAHWNRETIRDNFYITASYGGKYDSLIDSGFFKRYSKVVLNEEQADKLGLPIDHDDSHCFGDGPFALLVHGNQPAGSVWREAINQRKKAGKFTGYNQSTKAKV